MVIRQPVTIPPMSGPLWGGPGGFRNFVFPCGAETEVDATSIITLNLPVYADRFHTLLQQQCFGFISDVDCVGDISLEVGNSGALPVYRGSAQASGSNIALGDYCQVAYDTDLDNGNGGFHLLNWTQPGGSSATGNTVVETTAGPFSVAADTFALVLNKAVASVTSITLPPVADRGGLALVISDFAGNAGDITITPDGAETIMGVAQAVLASTGQGVGAAGGITLYPNEDLNGWFA